MNGSAEELPSRHSLAKHKFDTIAFCDHLELWGLYLGSSPSLNSYAAQLGHEVQAQWIVRPLDGCDGADCRLLLIVEPFPIFFKFLSGTMALFLSRHCMGIAYVGIYHVGSSPSGGFFCSTGLVRVGQAFCCRLLSSKGCSGWDEASTM
jgi:hypothetical protein